MHWCTADPSHRQFLDRPPTLVPFFSYLAVAARLSGLVLARSNGREGTRLAFRERAASPSTEVTTTRRSSSAAPFYSTRRSRNGRVAHFERFKPRCRGGSKADLRVHCAVCTRISHLADGPRSRCSRPLGSTICHGVPLHIQAAPWEKADPASKRGQRQKVSGADAAEALTLHDPLMILPQVHLRKPCYDFYFL
ncbi:hypothetical protein HPB51_027765 [Rhipicephalus microplus]|uniref:Uncharacterized protein n=1 Tax=Rhipicephalus microplus TaxID=6941 RepID=A0A9J6CZH0_RHIMP|nr:hypothetical protein HPB51_027765 [Rhipicephalus microplus]